MKILTSWSQCIVPMLPQHTVQPKNKEACTAAPLCPPEHGAKSFNPCVDGDKFYATSAFIVARLDLKRETEKLRVGGCVSWGRRWTTISPYRHGIRQSATAQEMLAEVLLVFLGLLVKPAIQPDALFPALDGYGRKVLPGLPCKVLTNGVSSIPTLELKGDSVEGIQHPWICFSESLV